MNYWAVGATFNKTKDMSKEFLEQSIWYDGDKEESDKEILDQVNIGDILLMKSGSTKGKGHSISFTKLKAIGKVLSKKKYYDFKMEWFNIKDLPLDFNGIWYSKTIERMREDEMLNYAKQILKNEKQRIEIVQSKLIKNTLIWCEKPKDGYTELGETKRTFNEVDIDFQKKTVEQKDLGDKGEELVRLWEIESLSKKGFLKEADNVKIVKDGVGYDVLSFDVAGNEKYIEVKTTYGNELIPFYLSDNEVDFMRQHPNQYCIYRVYNYDEVNNSGNCFEIIKDVEFQLIMQPKTFKVYLKKV